MRVFDVYRGEQVPAGKQSIAFSVVFQSPERTLSDEDARRLRGDRRRAPRALRRRAPRRHLAPLWTVRHASDTLV